MYSISLQNFRRFQELKPIDFTGITMLVGGNNSGKSTVVKASILAYYFLLSKTKSQYSNSRSAKRWGPSFRFDIKSPYDVHVGSFQRALCNNANDEQITFDVDVCGFDITIMIQRGEEDKNCPWGKVSYLRIHDRRSGWHFIYDYSNCMMILELIDKHRESAIKSLEEIEASLKEAINVRDNSTDFEEISKANQLIQEKEAQVAQLRTQVANSNHRIIVPYAEKVVRNERFLLPFLMENIIEAILLPIPPHINKNSAEYKRLLAQQEFVNSHLGILRSLPSSLERELNELNLLFIPAHAAAQKTVFDANSTSDYLGETLHQIVSSRLVNNEKVKKFIKTWMDEDHFNIGRDFAITSHGGECYEIEIVDSSDKKVHLGDKGMGSIQVMTLLLRLAPLVDSDCNAQMVFIEEPEQNLHPCLQSRLFLLFDEMAKQYGIRFVIETHSEYLVRKSQVMATKKEELEDLPFSLWYKVYYFPEKTEPYEMIYQEDGCFENDFGEGFFDEAANLAIEIL